MRVRVRGGTYVTLVMEARPRDGPAGAEGPTDTKEYSNNYIITRSELVLLLAHAQHQLPSTSCHNKNTIEHVHILADHVTSSIC